MKRKFVMAAAIGVFLCLTGVSAQNEATPEKAAKDFYSWYIHELNAEHNPVQQRKTMMLRRVSKRLGSWIYSKAYEEYGADYFLDAQDWDAAWENNIVVSRVVVKGNRATLRVTLSAPATQTDLSKRELDVTFLKEAGTWKIDRVKGR